MAVETPPSGAHGTGKARGIRGARFGNPQDIAAGVVLMTLAAIFSLQALELDPGSPARMGPGFFPLTLCALVALFGVGLVVKGLRTSGPPLDRWSPARLLPVLLAIVFFALTIRILGLLAAGSALMLLSALAARDFRMQSTVLFTGVLVTFAAILFSFLLGLPLPVWPRF